MLRVRNIFHFSYCIHSTRKVSFFNINVISSCQFYFGLFTSLGTWLFCFFNFPFSHLYIKLSGLFTFCEEHIISFSTFWRYCLRFKPLIQYFQIRFCIHLHSSIIVLWYLCRDLFRNGLLIVFFRDLRVLVVIRILLDQVEIVFYTIVECSLYYYITFSWPFLYMSYPFVSSIIIFILYSNPCICLFDNQ